MSRIDHRSYHAARAEAELQLATEAANPAIARLHRELAALHKRQLMAIVDEEDQSADESNLVACGY